MERKEQDVVRMERSVAHNYLVMEHPQESYKIRMLESNRIPGLLPVALRETDGKRELVYDISSSIMMHDALVTRSLGVTQIRTMVRAVDCMLRELSLYLLDPDDILLDGEFVFLKTPEMQPSFCCVPDQGRDFSGDLSLYLRDILGAVDQRDKEAVVLAYSLYQASLKPNYLMSDLMGILDGKIMPDRAAMDAAGDASPGDAPGIGEPNRQSVRSLLPEAEAGTESEETDEYSPDRFAVPVETDPAKLDEMFEFLTDRPSESRRMAEPESPFAARRAVGTDLVLAHPSRRKQSRWRKLLGL